MTQLADSYASRLDGHLREVAQIAQTNAGLMQTIDNLADEKIYEQLQRDVMQSPFVYGACMAFEPGTLKPTPELFAPYVCREGEDGYRRVNIDQSVYDWYRDPKYTWFTRPKSLGRGVWSEPYFDEGAGNVLMATFSAPFTFRGAFGGVCTVDIDLPRLQNTVGRYFDQDLDFVILAGDGRFVYDPQPSRIMHKTIFDVARESGHSGLEALGRRMLEGTSGTATIDGWDSSESQWVFFAPIRSAGWTVAARFPERRVLADVRQRALWSAAALGLTLLLTVGCVVGVARMVTAPISRLKEKVLEVGRGDLDVHIDDKSARTDELRQLAGSFNRMTSELRAHVDRLATEQAARARIEHDLDIAREIQRGLLPTTRLEVPGFDVAGWNLAADKTGGDYYDWQKRPAHGDGAESGVEETLVTLADVSGHGVGPALVTAVCRAYVRASFAAGREFCQLIEQLNDLLVADLPDDRFVTFAAALIEPASKQVRMISAGHGPIIRYVARDKSLVDYDTTGVPLGLFTDVEYRPAETIDLQPGDVLVLITDGFFEWSGSDGEQFGIERLRQAIRDTAHLPAARMIAAIYEQVKAFTEGTPQPDDVTAVVIQRRRDTLPIPQSA
jgi:sigma-B regulation protein RsbU (phosphoserine phosphatase)